MKKKICWVITVMVIMASIATATVWAKTFQSDWVSEKINKGYTEKEAYSMMAIMVLSGENVSAFVEQKHKELGDWDEVAEFYGINLTDFHVFIEQQEQAARDLSIPDELYAEMKAEGMTDDECKELARSAFNLRIDIEAVWQGKKDGKTPTDLKREETELKNSQGQAAADFATGKITEKEYMEKMQALSPEMAMSDIIAFATSERREWMKFRKAASGITDAELAAAERAGMTDFFAVCRLKDVEKLSNKTFNEMLLQVKSGVAVDKVITENMSSDKIEAAQAQSE